jgi:hypothetical protein
MIATSESRVTHSKILMNQWRNRTSSRDQLGHQLAFTKTDDEPGNVGEVCPLHQQAFDQRPGVIRDEVLFEAIDKLASTIFALIVLFAIVDVPVFLVLE